MLIVQKFGGSSLADIEKLRRAAEIAIAARDRGNKVAVVVSAMGDETDTLIQLAHAIDPAASARELDALMSTGEMRASTLLAIMLQRMGTPAVSLSGWQSGMYTDAQHGAARLALTFPGRVAMALHEGKTPVITGFQGIDMHGDITTLGRGGSDTSAVALAVALGADRCEIYTDVDGIYTADPRLVTDARRLDEIDTRDMLCLAQRGSQVLDAHSVELALEHGMALHVMSAASATGCTVVHTLTGAQRPPYAGVTRDTDAALVTLVGRDCRSHTLPELASVLSEAGVNVRGGRMGAGYASVRVDEAQVIFALSVLHRYMFG